MEIVDRLQNYATSHKVEVNSDFHSKKSVLYREDCMNQKYTSPQLYEKLQNYLLQTLGISVKFSQWNGKKNLQFFLTNTYDFYEGALLKQKFLFVIVKESGEITPATIKQHFVKIAKESENACILVQLATASYNRKRLIEYRIPFIIPGNQMYLPELGIDLREYFKPVKERKKLFSPATQVVLINALLSKRRAPSSLSGLTANLGYTSMTMSRAFDELENASIGNILKKGKERLLLLEESKRELWEKTKPSMRSPTRKRIWAKGKKPKILAGLSALAKETMLAPPTKPVYAVYFKEWKQTGIIEVPYQDDASFELEIWHYNPNLFSRNGSIDPYSLYLSLQEIEDERIEVALEELMEKLK